MSVYEMSKMHPHQHIRGPVLTEENSTVTKETPAVCVTGGEKIAEGGVCRCGLKILP